MTWLFAAIADCVKMRFCDTSAFSTRNLTPQTGNKKGMLDLLLVKKECKDHLCFNWMPNAGIKPESVTAIKQVVASHAMYRSKVMPYPSDDADLMDDFGPCLS